MICVKAREVDGWVSGSIIDHGVWEEKEVIEVMKMMDKFPEAVFLDIGSNIGFTNNYYYDYFSNIFNNY